MEHITIYYNRKMYSKNRRGYITLQDIRDLIVAGKDVQVLEHKSEVDVTTEVLSHVLTVCDNLKYGQVKQLIIDSAKQ